MGEDPRRYGEGRPPIPHIPIPLILFTINQWTEELRDSEQRLYDRTRCCWRIGGKPREGAVFGLGISHGVVRSAYHIRSWEQFEDGRWRFDGESAPYLGVIGTSIERIRPKQGEVNPVRFFENGIPPE